jgi:hypothetical protein
VSRVVNTHARIARCQLPVFTVSISMQCNQQVVTTDIIHHIIQHSVYSETSGGSDYMMYNEQAGTVDYRL